MDKKTLYRMVQGGRNSWPENYTRGSIPISSWAWEEEALFQPLLPRPELRELLESAAALVVPVGQPAAVVLRPALESSGWRRKKSLLRTSNQLPAKPTALLPVVLPTKSTFSTKSNRRDLERGNFEWQSFCHPERFGLVLSFFFSPFFTNYQSSWSSLTLKVLQPALAGSLCLPLPYGTSLFIVLPLGVTTPSAMTPMSEPGRTKI